jgi:S-adenosylmethionine/arginine decarboxylase-like enzyme
MLLDHKHLLIRAECENIPRQGYPIDKKLEHLVELIEMKILTGPFCAWCPVVGNTGWSGTVIIETSHIAWHSWNETGLINLDIYSCKDFDVHSVIEWMEEFKPTYMDYKFLDRNNGFKTLKQDNLEFDN